MASILFQSSWTSIIFEGRNKFYGAYEIRQSYERNMLLGLFITCAALGTATFCTVWFLNFSGQITTMKPEPKETIFEFIMDEKVFATPQQEIAKPTVKSTTRSFVPALVQDPIVESKPSDLSEAVTATNGVTDNQGNSEAGAVNAATGQDVTTIVPAVPDVAAKPEIRPYAEVMPVFEGSIQKYIAQHFNYPQEATRMGIEGKMFVEIILDEKGKVISARVLKSLGYGCDEEALRTVLGMPDWKTCNARKSSCEDQA